ncbi:PREDICTED: putative nuclease HARBI1 [Poecilia mexicana]|uniref:putative nuclease HARBI1 n=1 Tax=Poecilia mexicana TaxID=48701 RepID=UPI00072E2E3D|nr:PREDICTED: putative nuclease HARBI1 [Poecilia mexicana]XP_016528745.1 PREDICTED: putative nuclease HARBI1 [Poecilia formosa]
MDDMDLILLLINLKQLINFRQQATLRRQTPERLLRIARRNTEEKYRRLFQTIWQYEAEDASPRRNRMISFRRLRGPTVWAFNRSSHWWDVIVPGFTHSQWLQKFRMSEDTINHLCARLRHVLERTDTNFQKCVPLKKRVAIALWKLATGSEYRSIGHLFGVNLATVCECVQEFCAAIQTVLVPELIKIPSAERFEEIAAYFENRWGLPQCVGAIDGSHIPIIAPTTYHCDFFNRKGWHSLILQGVVDGKGLFWNICVGMPGTLHDARVLRLSSLWELATHGNLFPPHTKEIGTVKVGYYVIGDSAYPLQDWLMKPFPDTVRLTTEQQKFNSKLSRARWGLSMLLVD